MCTRARVHISRAKKRGEVGWWLADPLFLFNFFLSSFFLSFFEGRVFLWKKRFCSHFERRRYIYPALRSLDERCQHTGVSASGEHYPPPRQFNFANQSGIAALRELLAASNLLLRFQLKLRAKPSCELLLAK